MKKERCGGKILGISEVTSCRAKVVCCLKKLCGRRRSMKWCNDEVKQLGREGRGNS